MEGNEEGDCHVASAPRNDAGEKVRDDARGRVHDDVRGRGTRM